MAPVALHIPYVQEKLRKDFKIAAQNAWVKGSGAYTGEIRYATPRLAKHACHIYDAYSLDCLGIPQHMPIKDRA